ncbi:MAG: hypothetical protein KY453_00735 [Gemmatimonadetes bacterium]|nr:hypothetical protein [Gemmatimonadota bacterium]
MAVLSPPSNVHEIRAETGMAWVVPAAQAWASETLDAGKTLYEAAGSADDVLELRGRGPVYAFATAGGRWVVRRCRRGGAMAPLLGERFLRTGPPRPLLEMAASEEARKRGIPTPDVLAAAVYPDGPFYRGDVVTEYVAESRDLASLLFGADAPEAGAVARAAVEDPEVREAALRDAGYMLARMARAGVEHPDLNAKNVLLEWHGERVSALLVDLDRVRVHPPGAALSAGAMHRRLARSLRKFERAAGRRLTRSEWAALADPLPQGDPIP